MSTTTCLLNSDKRVNSVMLSARYVARIIGAVSSCALIRAFVAAAAVLCVCFYMSMLSALVMFPSAVGFIKGIRARLFIMKIYNVSITGIYQSAVLHPYSNIRGFLKRTIQM